MSRVIGTLVAYQFTKMLGKPWKEWEIHKLGLIDDEGKQIKKASTRDEKIAMNLGTILVMNIKRLIEKLPFGKTRIGSLAAALYLLKEHEGVLDDVDFEAEFGDFINIPRHLIKESAELEMLSAGKYIDVETDAMYIIEDTEFFAKELGIPLFKVQDLITKSHVVVSASDIRKV